MGLITLVGDRKLRLFFTKKRAQRQRLNVPSIIQVAAYYPPHLGGLERVTQEIAEQLGRDGYNVTVLTSNVGAKNLPRVEYLSHLVIKRLRAFYFAHTAFIPSLFWQLLRVRKPAVIHLHLAQAYVPEMVWLVAKLRGIPYVVHFHLDVERSGRLGFIFDWWKRCVQPLIIKDAVFVITLSHDQTKLVLERYRKSSNQVIYIGNGVGKQFLEIGKTKRVFHNPLRLLFVGRLSIQKRIDRIIEALSFIKVPVTLTVVGDGEERVELENCATKLGLKNIIFLGALKGVALLEAYRQADVFVLPSDREGMPLAILEAMATGLPIVGSNVIGIHELVKDVGVLVDNPSGETFAEALTNLWNEPARLQELSKKVLKRPDSSLGASLSEKQRMSIKKWYHEKFYFKSRKTFIWHHGVVALFLWCFQLQKQIIFNFLISLVLSPYYFTRAFNHFCNRDQA